MRELTDYEAGFINGVVAYAWWKDGSRFVGTTGRTVKDAVCDFLMPRGGFTIEDCLYLARQA